MKRVKNRDNVFLVIWLMCVLILIGACNLGFFKETWSAFGNTTGQLTLPYTMEYFSNYPDDVEIVDEQRTENVAGKTYSIMANVFDVFGYEFVNWNTLADGTGEVYNPNDSISLESNLIFYAQWKKVEVSVISYGDVNLDGVINGDDFLLVDRFIVMGDGLIGQGLLNADVNVDGNVDLVDADIIKQVCLGTEGYVGILPDNPILIYEIYNGNVEDEPEEENPDDIGQNGDSDQGGETSGGNGQTGNLSGGNNNGGSSGSGSSGGGTSNKPSSNKENKPSSGGNSSGDKKEESDLIIDKEDDVIVEDESNVENKEDDVLNEDNNGKENDKLNDNKVNINENKKIYSIIIVFGICLLSFRLIIYVIHRFKEKEKMNSDKEDI